MNIDKWEKTYLRVRRGVKLREKRIRIFKLDRAWRILELGCGDGLNLKIMQRLGYANIYGLDNSQELLKHIPDIPRICADMRATGLAAETFDAVFIDSVLHHLYDQKDCLREIRRILKPRGIFCILEPRNSLLRKLFDMATFSPLSLFIPFLKDRRVIVREEYELYNRWLKTGHNLKDSLCRCGFKTVFWKIWLIGMGIKCELIK